MGTRNSRTMREASRVEGNDIESLRSLRQENCLSICKNRIDERASNRGSLLRNIRSRKSKNTPQGSESMISNEGSLESSFDCSSKQSEGIEELLSKTKFTRLDLQRMYRGFKNDCPQGYVDKETFKKIYAQFFPHGESGQYAALVFNAFDLNRRGKLSYENFIMRLSTALHGANEDKLKWIFLLYDVDGDFAISKQDLNIVVSAVHDLVGSSGDHHVINKQVLRIFEILGPSDDGFVTQDVFIGNCANIFPTENFHKLQPDSLPKSVIDGDGDNDGVFTDERLESLLLARRNDCGATFQLGQFYFERQMFNKALVEFEKVQESDVEALYQLGVMYYDGLGVQSDATKGFKIMESLCEVKDHESLVVCAQYNLGRAYYAGKGVKQSDVLAEHFWLLTARAGSPRDCSVKAQTLLGMFYSRHGEESYDIEKSYYWHQEASGNGSIESQGALGVMFEYGIGVQCDVLAAFQCLKGAAEKGNIYAQGNLAMHYYRQKFYNQALEIAKSVGKLENVEKLAKVTGCIVPYVAKGIALGCFVYARCLDKGLGVERNANKSVIWLKRSYKFDPETVTRFEDDMIYGYV